MEKHFTVNDKRINNKGCNKDQNPINIQCNSGSVEVMGNYGQCEYFRKYKRRSCHIYWKSWKSSYRLDFECAIVKI